MPADGFHIQLDMFKADNFLSSNYYTNHLHGIYPSNNTQGIVLCISSPQKKLATKSIILESESLNTRSA